jgi:hypothetical protein
VTPQSRKASGASLVLGSTVKKARTSALDKMNSEREALGDAEVTPKKLYMLRNRPVLVKEEHEEAEASGGSTVRDVLDPQ